MRRKLILPILAAVFMVTGCGGHLNFTAFARVQQGEKDTLRNKLIDSPFKNMKLPTKLPYTLNGAELQDSVKKMNKTHHVSILLVSGSHELTIDEYLGQSQNRLPTFSDPYLKKKEYTRLNDGTKALYENDGQASMLFWDKKHVGYILSSTLNGKPDLSKQQLIQVAESFK